MARWNELVQVIPEQVGGRLEDESAAAVLDTLLDTQEEQLTLLRRLHRELRQLQEGPFNSGRVHLEAARRPHRTRGERLELLLCARGAFRKALGAEQDRVRLSLLCLHLGFCGLLLGGTKDAREWMELAHRTAVEEMKAILTRAAGDKGLPRNRYLGHALGLVVHVTSAATLGAGYLLWDRLFSRRADTALRQALAQLEPLTDYVNTVGALRLRLGEAAAHVPRYALTWGVDDDRYLSRVTIRKLLSDKEAMYFNGRETRRVTWNDSERSEVLTRELL